MKNRYSHVCEAFEYGLLGGGEARAALGRKAGASKIGNTRAFHDPLARTRQARPDALQRGSIFKGR